MRIVFLGSGTFAIPSFEALVDAGHEVVAVVTQPDRERGRGRELASTPLKPVAEERGVAVEQPRRIREPEARDSLLRLAPEIQVVVAYGQILPREVIDIPPHGTVNVHASLLPRYRGAAPIQWAIANGETETGVTTMLLDEGLDTGPILLARPTAIGPEETGSELTGRLARLGAELLLETLRGIETGAVRPVPQDHSKATMAPILRKEDGRVAWDLSAQTIANRVRGFHPWPGTRTSFEGRGLGILEARPSGPGEVAKALTERSEPGAIVGAGRSGIVVACGGGTHLRLVRVQPEGRRPMSAEAFAAGARLGPGARFG